MISAKMATLGLLKIKVIWNKGHDVIISVHEVTNKNLSRDLDYIADVVMWPKFTKLVTLAFLCEMHQNLNFLSIWCVVLVQVQ